MASNKFTVSSKTFNAIQKVNIEYLSYLSEQDIKPILPCLVRMSLCSPLDQSAEWVQNRQVILKILSGIEPVNSLVALLSINFHALEIDVKKEQQLRMKIGGFSCESILISSLTRGLALEFEQSEPASRLRLFLSELLVLMAMVKENRDFGIRPSELFDNDVYLEEVSDVLCIAQAELPGLLQIQEVAEALLHVKNGTTMICRMVANSPDSFKEVCLSLLVNGEKQDEDSPNGRIRMQSLCQLCQMNMSQALAIRSKAVEMCRMPGLAIMLTLDYCRQEHSEVGDFDSVVGDLVAFISGLLLGSDDKIRTWFAQYVRNCQKKNESGGHWTLQPLRDELLQRLQILVQFSVDEQNLPDCKVVQASSLLRLYCALRGIAGLKFHDDEINLLLQLLTSHPPPSPSGIRFVSLGLCMLLACPTLLGTPEQERKAIDWIRWLLIEEGYFGRVSGVSASFGEMLLLIAIHFHSNQMSSITDLVCSTLGMKVMLRANTLARMKTIFTQEIFTDQVVTAHAVKVPVTLKLSGNTPGFLPVHCIHQLLKSRAFTKYKVPIKDWIYKQLCNTVAPLHPVLPALVEVYVNSVLVPSSKASHDTTNEPISEDEILEVFRNSILVETSNSGHASPSLKGKFSSGRNTPIEMEIDESPASLSSQLLLLYYLLLYEDTRLTNMKVIVPSNRKVKKYSAQFLAQLPIFYLVQEAQKKPEHFAGIFAPLLRLLATHYPHLCLVQDWLSMDSSSDLAEGNRPLVVRTRTTYNKHSLARAFSNIQSCAIELLAHLEYLLSIPLQQLWPFAQIFVERLPMLLNNGIPRQILDKSKQIWQRLNSVFPRRLWVITVNSFRYKGTNFKDTPIMAKPIGWDEIVLDPLHVLRCDERVFRCAPLLEITLHMLRAFLAASKTHFNNHMLENPLLEKTGQLETEKEREELCITLVAAQESAAVQILLESCLLTSEDKVTDGCLMSSLREIQSLISSHLHQVFIADPSLVKLVHFQGYNSELLPVTVSSIPSMHICLDFIPELLSQPHTEKQVFAIELSSYLCIQYAIPKSLSIAKLCLNVSHTLLGVLTSEKRPAFFLPVLPALIRMCKAFPPLCEDVVCLLTQLGKICLSDACVMSHIAPLVSTADLFVQFPNVEQFGEVKATIQKLPSNNALCKMIQTSFANLCDVILLERKIY